jgi:hypothetical protein
VWRIIMASCVHGCMGGILRTTGRGGKSIFAALHVHIRGVNPRIHHTGVKVIGSSSLLILLAKSKMGTIHIRQVLEYLVC